VQTYPSTRRQSLVKSEWTWLNIVSSQEVTSTAILIVVLVAGSGILAAYIGRPLRGLGSILGFCLLVGAAILGLSIVLGLERQRQKNLRVVRLLREPESLHRLLVQVGAIRIAEAGLAELLPEALDPSTKTLCLQWVGTLEALRSHLSLLTADCYNDGIRPDVLRTALPT